jgi:cellulose synthase/poly-beta-1,6-N-acetylglucosamine synthase-like glycosyltransferase
MKKDISIVVPVKNCVQTIGKLLESFMKIDYKKEKIELLLIDDKSSDGTREIIKKYPVKLIDQEGESLNAARNSGINNSTGDIIAFTDSDCIIPSDWVKNILDNFNDPNVSFVAGNVERYDQKKFLSIYSDETFFKIKPRFDYKKEIKKLIPLNFPTGCNMAIRKSALEKITLFDERIKYGFDDIELIEQISNNNLRMVMDPKVRVWHQHRKNLIKIIKQHFKYGRGGALLLIYKENTQLAKWFRIYLASTTLGIILFVGSIITSIIIKNILPFQIIIILFTSGIMVLQIFYIKISIETKKIIKILIYPIIDLARGFSMTFGGILQYLITKKNNYSLL